jgi:anaerobic magnesium-protoporphyrin IX monomethyl ester cyclase
MTDVELVFPYVLHGQKQWVLPPLGLGYLAAALEKKDIDWGITDCTFLGLSAGLENIKRKKPKIVGVYSMVTFGQNTKYIAQNLRESVDYLVVGGPLPSVYPDNFFPEFDFCVLGEADFSFPALAERILSGSEFDDIPGVVFKNEDKSKRTRYNHIMQNLGTIPHPIRSEFPNEKYMEYWRENFGYSPASIIATRGCPYACDFCSKPTTGTKFRKRSIEDILHEIKGIHDLGYNYLWFADDAFTFDTNFVMELSEGITGLGYDINWDCLSRVDKVDDELVLAMKKSGLTRVYMGIESGSDETLALMKKGAKVDDADLAISLFKKHGISTGGFFMIGYPGETLESIWRTVEFSAREDLDYISYTVPYPLPGSDLYNRHKTYVDPTKEWLEERENTVFVDCGISGNLLRDMIEVAQVAHKIAKTKGRTQALDYLSDKKREFGNIVEG